MLKSLSVNTPAHDCCDTEEMPEDCCHDEAQEFLVDEFKVVSPTSISTGTLGPLLYTIQYFLLSEAIRSEASHHSYLTSELPPTAGSKIFIKIQSFLI